MTPTLWKRSALWRLKLLTAGEIRTNCTGILQLLVRLLMCVKAECVAVLHACLLEKGHIEVGCLACSLTRPSRIWKPSGRSSSVGFGTVAHTRSVLNACVPCSRDWEDVSRLLSDIGLILEYADILAGQPGQPSGCGLLETQLCLQHVASLACMHLPFICGKGWPALASRVSTPC